MEEDDSKTFEECRDFLMQKLEGTETRFVLLLVAEETHSIEVAGDLAPEVLREILHDTLQSLEQLIKQEGIQDVHS